MERYDPNQPQEPSDWLETDEVTRLNLVMEHHSGVKPEPPNKRLHAAMHVVVENQIAVGENAATETVERLMREGLDRHDALHAIGAVLAQDIHALLSAGKGTFDQDRYRSRLNELTAKRWRKGIW